MNEHQRDPAGTVRRHEKHVVLEPGGVLHNREVPREKPLELQCVGLRPLQRVSKGGRQPELQWHGAVADGDGGVFLSGVEGQPSFHPAGPDPLLNIFQAQEGGGRHSQRRRDHGKFPLLRPRSVFQGGSEGRSDPRPAVGVPEAAHLELRCVYKIHHAEWAVAKLIRIDVDGKLPEGKPVNPLLQDYLPSLRYNHLPVFRFGEAPGDAPVVKIDGGSKTGVKRVRGCAGTLREEKRIRIHRGGEEVGPVTAFCRMQEGKLRQGKEPVGLAGGGEGLVQGGDRLGRFALELLLQAGPVEDLQRRGAQFVVRQNGFGQPAVGLL